MGTTATGQVAYVGIPGTRSHLYSGEFFSELNAIAQEQDSAIIGKNTILELWNLKSESFQFDL